jgi:hypothetical protein
MEGKRRKEKRLPLRFYWQPLPDFGRFEINIANESRSWYRPFVLMPNEMRA